MDCEPPPYMSPRAAIGPFSLARREHEGRRSYFLPSSFSRVEINRPVHLIGTRGAGKTTFLQALTSSERLENTSLQRQLRERDGELFAGHYIGVYMKLPKSQMYVFDRWIADTKADREIYSDLVGLYLSLGWAQLMCDAVAGLIEASELQVPLKAEREVVAQLCDEYTNSGYRQHLDPDRVRTLRAAARAYREMHRALERRAQMRGSIEEVADEFPVQRLTAMAHFVARALLTLMPPADDPPWSFRICIDEAESMSERQRVVMNSVVRNSEWPLLPVVAWVSLSTWANVTDSPLTVGKADVADVPLDQMSDAEFREFAEGVATVRIMDTEPDAGAHVDLKECLGTLDINGLLEQIIARSSSSTGRRLLVEAEANRARPYFSDSRSKAPPIYQTYLVQRLNLEVPEEGTAAWAKRGQHSAEIRKKIVAAYLSICRELSTEPWYASVEMVMQMSDCCVRDFLWQMDELWQIHRRAPARFLKERIRDADQDKALKRASEQKMARIAGLVITGPRQAERLVDGLGALTAELQRPRKELAESGAAHLRSPEPGNWVLPAPPKWPLDDSEQDGVVRVYGLVADAADAGYLRIGSGDEGPWHFRVHTSLAAHYGFSYRGAQYQVRLEPQDLLDLCEAATDAERRRVVSSLYQRLRGTDVSLLSETTADD